MHPDYNDFQSNSPQEYFKSKNLKNYDLFQVNIELAYRLIEQASKYPPATESEASQISLTFKRPEELNEDLKKDFRKWLIMAGFDELFNWIKEVLIDYLFLRECLDKGTSPKNEEEFMDIRKPLYKLHIPALIEKCQSFVGELEQFKNYNCYNKIRNCLHHRNEILTKDFCDDGKDLIEIKGKRFVLFYDNGKDRKEVLRNQPGLEGAGIMLGQWDFTLERKLNEKIEFSLQEFLWLKDLGLILYLNLAQNLFGVDNSPLLTLDIAYKIEKVKE
jgi:hypothetical protein